MFIKDIEEAFKALFEGFNVDVVRHPNSANKINVQVHQCFTIQIPLESIKTVESLCKHLAEEFRKIPLIKKYTDNISLMGKEKDALKEAIKNKDLEIAVLNRMIKAMQTRIIVRE